MSRLSKRWCYFAGCLVLLVFFGCSSSDNSRRPGAVARGAGSSERMSGDLQVRIVPEAPTIASTLQAVCRGPGSPRFRWEKNGAALDESGATLTGKDFHKGDTLAVIVSADGKEGRAEVVIGNSPPEISSVSWTPEIVRHGTDLVVTPSGSDADGDYLWYSYRWQINGTTLADDAPLLRGDRFARGDRISLAITPNDTDGPGRPFVVPDFIVPNSQPYFVSTPPNGFQGTMYVYNAVARDPDGDPLTYSLGQAPAGMTINPATGRISWAIGSRDAGAHTVEVVALDSNGSRQSQIYTITVNIP